MFLQIFVKLGRLQLLATLFVIIKIRRITLDVLKFKLSETLLLKSVLVGQLVLFVSVTTVNL
jgi:hypothetical protein